MRRGFTLLEVLIAAAIGAVLLLLTSQVFTAAARTRERLFGTATEQSALRRTFETMSRDMHSALVPPDDSGLQFGLSTGAGGVGSNVLQFAAGVGEPILAGRAANETVLVQYAIAPDPETGRPALWRYDTAYPVPEGAQPGTSQDTRSQLLLREVTAATYLFYSAGTQEWKQSWDEEPGLPAAIRVDLAFQGRDGTGEPSQESWVFSLPASPYATDEAAANEATQ